MIKNPVLNYAGTWLPVTDPDFLAGKYGPHPANWGTVPSFALIPLGSAGQYGMVVDGFEFVPTLTAPAPVNIAIFAPDASGNLTIQTNKYISDTSTPGVQSIVVADFNGDGRPDIFLAPYNETPFISLPSIAYLSNANGTYSKVTIPGNLDAHDAQLAYVNGKPIVVTGTDFPGLNNPIYTFENGAFVVHTSKYFLTPSLSGTIINSYSGYGYEEARGDVTADYSVNPHIQFNINGSTNNIVIYNFDGIDAQPSGKPIQVIEPYLSTLPQYKSFVSQWGAGQTHTYQIWSTDLNNDGKADLIAAESMWNPNIKNHPSALDILINKGDGTFIEETAKLNPDMGFMQSEFCYVKNFVDIDHSGIETLLLASNWDSIASRQSNYVMLNDGTGHLYVGMHDEFLALASKVYDYLGFTWWKANAGITTPFEAIPQPDGSINFVAVVNVPSTDGAWQFVNVPLHYNPSTDFTTNVTISDRNDSMLMRTWAGNDIIYDTNANAKPAHIDGGLGFNTAVYSGASSQYKISINDDGSESVASLSGAKVPWAVNDTLVNINQIQFSDSTVVFDRPASGLILDTIDFQDVVNVTGLTQYDTSWYEFT